MQQTVRCPKCAAEVEDPTQPCPRCGYVMEHPQRRRYQRHVLFWLVVVLAGYVLGMIGTVAKQDWLGIPGLAMGSIGGVWLMVSLYRLLRTGV